MLAKQVQKKADYLMRNAECGMRNNGVALLRLIAQSLSNCHPEQAQSAVAEGSPIIKTVNCDVRRVN